MEEEEEIPFMSPAKYLQNGFYVGTGSNLGVNNVRIPFIEHPSLLALALAFKQDRVYSCARITPPFVLKKLNARLL